MKSNQNFICATSKLFPLEAAKERETIIGLPTRCPMMMTTRAKVSLIFGTHCALATDKFDACFYGLLLLARLMWFSAI